MPTDDSIFLKDNRRQREAWERQAVALIRDGAAPAALALYAAHDRLHVGETDHGVKQAIIDRWRRFDAPIDSLLIAHSRRDVADLNGRARAVLQAKGRLGAAELWGEGGAFSVGDIVTLRVNSRRQEVRNGDRGVVTHVDLKRRTLTVELDGRSVELDGEFLARRTRHRRAVLEHGYAITAHAAQGSTCRHTLVLARDDTYREWAYSALTRATEGSHLFVVASADRDRDQIAPAEPAADARVVLAAALTRERAEELAIDRLYPSRERHLEP